LRARRNLFGKSDIGVLLQNRAATDSTTWNRSAGVDANLRLGGNTIINAYAARSDAAGTARDGSAARVQMAYRGKLWDNSLLIKRVTESFSPGIGFVRRRNFQQFYTTIGAHPRPAVRGVAELNPYVLVDYITDLRSQLDTRTLAAGLDVTLRSEAVLSMLVSDQFDRIEQTFTLVPGRTVAPGAYGWREGTAKFTMAPGSRLYRIAAQCRWRSRLARRAFARNRDHVPAERGLARQRRFRGQSGWAARAVCVLNHAAQQCVCPVQHANEILQHECPDQLAVGAAQRRVPGLH
jgi:hypothetical protein